MTFKINENAGILIASDQRAESESLRKVIDQHFPKTVLSFDARHATEDFEAARPDLILLAFNQIEHAQRYYLGLYRFGSLANTHPHRTIVLCNKEEVRKAYELCCKQYFDDYVLFWPAPYDGYRLLMSMHVALRALKLARDAVDERQLMHHADDLNDLEKMLDERLAAGGREVELVSEQMQHRSNQLNNAMNALLKEFRQVLRHEASPALDAKQLEQKLATFMREEIRPLVGSGTRAIEPLRQWTSELQRESSLRFSRTRVLAQIVQQLRRRILVVDDDEFSQKLVSRLLENEGLEPICAGSVAEAMALVQKARPSLILMDYMLPGEDGRSAIRRLKSIDAFAGIPVIMLTGQRDRETVVNCLSEGACDFVAKPVDPVALVSKIRRYLSVEPCGDIVKANGI
ncbi:MAG TPA: response regulator [Rhodanobacter sp.]|jgi:CheY-like chemotaxis protein|nr:response regulator [Rhodanobacter sp.]